MKKILLIGFLLIFILGCTAQQQTQRTQPREPLTVQIGNPSQPSQEPPLPQVPPAQASQVREINVEMRQFEFSPPTITIDKGDRVKLIITSLDVAHGFSLPDFNIETGPVSPGNTVIKEFTANKVGSFTFKCSNYCGSGHSGMRGMLIVNP